MSLATRCTACGTIFRVVQDQLKVSEGWVRCGRCDAVFQAAESLFDLEREAPPAWAPSEAVSRPSTSGSPSNDDDAESSAVRPTESEVDRPAEPFEAPTSAEAALRALSAAAAAADVEARRAPPVDTPRPDARRGHRDGRSTLDADADADADADSAADADAIVMPAAWAEPSAAAEPVASAHSSLPSRRSAPSSVATWPPRSAGWQGWRARVGLSVVALLLVLALAAQAARQFSDIAAARWPQARTLLTPWCHWTGCSLAAPRRIDALRVESTSLAPDPGTEALRIGIVLRNRAPHAVALPSIDLSLTDSTGRLIARRTLQPGDFKPGADALPPRADVPLQALLLASGGPVTGYTVEIFYP